MNRLCVLICFVSMAAAAEWTADEKIARAMAAAPADVSGNALILDSDGSVLREGDNGWTCMVGNPPDYLNPMCNDAAWQEWVGAWMNRQAYQPKTLGISYMMVGDIPVDNDDPYGTDPNKGNWIQEGPHLMILVPVELLDGFTSDPYAGGPYVMFKDTDYAHLMVPLAPRE